MVWMDEESWKKEMSRTKTNCIVAHVFIFTSFYSVSFVGKVPAVCGFQTGLTGSWAQYRAGP